MDMQKQTYIDGRDPLPTPALDRFAQVAADFRSEARKVRYSWIATSGTYTFQGDSTAYSASEALAEAAKELQAQESMESEVYAEMTVTLKWAK